MQRIFAVGDLNVDLFTRTRIASPVSFGEERHAESFSYSLGGNAANFAAACGSLGLKAFLVSAIGSDVFTPFLLRELRRFGVAPLLHKSPDANGVSNIFVRGDGERAILSSKGCLLGIDANMVSRKLLSRIKPGDVVFFGGFFHLPKMRNGFSALLKAIRGRGGRVFFDACFDEYGGWKVKDFMGQVDVFFLNEVELRHITGLRGDAGVRKLLSMGPGAVVLKKGPGGASFHSIGGRKDSPALNVHAFNATGAGDFFNAGYAFGAARGFSAHNCLVCGNFVAGMKVRGKGYSAPRRKELEAYISKRSLAEVVRVKGYAAMSGAAAKAILRQLRKKPGSVISLAAGKTPAGVYRNLVRACRRGDADFSRAAFIELDEYIGTTNPKDTFAYSLRKDFIGKANFREKNVFMFNPHAKSLSAECRRIEGIVKRKGLDLALLGIGENAHIAFNEPGTPFNSMAHAVKISRGLLRARKKDFFGEEATHAFTLGLKTIMSARKVILIAGGRKKAAAIARSFSRKPSERSPASVLQRHGNAKVIVDSAAAGML